MPCVNILDFITALRKSDGYIEYIYTQGSCYQFHLMLSELFDGCTPYVNNEVNHVVTKRDDKFYDITGVVDGNFRPLTKKDLRIVKKWSFANNNLLKITECPYCEEPLVI